VESLGGLLPDDIVQRPKQGLHAAVRAVDARALRPFCEEHLGDRGLSARGLFRPSEIRGLWQSFLDGGRDVSWSRLWILVVLDDWLDRHGVN
jgi:asparagine synthase (glutamine-hydrolysing)